MQRLLIIIVTLGIIGLFVACTPEQKQQWAAAGQAVTAGATSEAPEEADDVEKVIHTVQAAANAASPAIPQAQLISLLAGAVGAGYGVIKNAKAKKTSQVAKNIVMSIESGSNGETVNLSEVGKAMDNDTKEFVKRTKSGK